MGYFNIIDSLSDIKVNEGKKGSALTLSYKL